MKQGAVLVLGLLLWAIFIGGCVESYSTPPANSDRGYLYIDLEEAIAAGWESQVLILGPATGRQICDGEYGCYAAHRPLEIKAVESGDEEVLEVLGFEQEEIGKLKGVRLRLKSHGEGEAKLRFVFAVEGMEPGAGEESVDEEGDFIDTFSASVRELARVELQRMVEGVDEAGPYGGCDVSGPGVYLMEKLDAYEIYLRFLKLDEEGSLLRGSGEFPFQVEPEGALELIEVEESAHLLGLRPLRFGSVKLRADDGGDVFEARFMSMGEVEGVEVRAYGLGESGERGAVASRFSAGVNYELAVYPKLQGAPLCGGYVAAQFESLTPAICEPLGEIQGRGTVALAAHNGGECMLKLTVAGANGGQGLVETLVVDVGYDF